MLKIEKIKALGTYWWFDIYEEVESAELIENAINSALLTFEKRFSRFLDDSLISQLNLNRELFSEDPELLQLLNIGIDLYQRTDGYFSFVNGQILENRGYNKDYTFTAKNDQEKLSAINDIQISKGKISLLNDAKIDLGGFGKGFMIDKIASILKEKFNLKYFLINGGGDIYVTSNNEKPVEILLEHPQREGEYFGSIDISNKSLCSSSPYKRRWKDSKTNKEYSHIINPYSINDISDLAVFTVADKTVYADAFSTAFTAAANDKAKISQRCNENDIEVLFIESGKIYKSPGFPTLK